MVISCLDLKEDLSSFIDGELDQQRQSLIAAHLAACSPCKSEHDGHRQLGKILAAHTESLAEGSPDIWSALSARLPGVCQCIQEDLSAYLDGELLAPAKEGVSSHLETCTVCLGKFQELSRVNGLLSKGLALPESFNVDIWSQVKSRLNDDCALIRSELSAFIDREVATLRHRAITAHLLECPECKSDFVGLSQAGESLRSYYQPDIPQDFDLWPQLKSKLQVVPFERRERKPGSVPARRLYAVAAVVVGGVLASISMFVTFHQSQPNLPAVTAEAYLIDSSLGEPADVAEAVVYDHQ